MTGVKAVKFVSSPLSLRTPLFTNTECTSIKLWSHFNCGPYQYNKLSALHEAEKASSQFSLVVGHTKIFTQQNL